MYLRSCNHTHVMHSNACTHYSIRRTVLYCTVLSPQDVLDELQMHAGAVEGQAAESPRTEGGSDSKAVTTAAGEEALIQGGGGRVGEPQPWEGDADGMLCALVWLHHLKSTTKRKLIVQWARELRLAGASKPGFPGEWCRRRRRGGVKNQDHA